MKIKAYIHSLKDHEHDRWSRSRGCWVSRAKAPKLWRVKRVAAKLGFSDALEARTL